MKCGLEFECTNNIVEYEALLIGLKRAQRMGIKNIRVIGDSDLIVLQVKNAYEAKNKCLREYRDTVQDTINSFDAFSIIVVPR